MVEHVCLEQLLGDWLLAHDEAIWVLCCKDEGQRTRQLQVVVMSQQNYTGVRRDDLSGKFLSELLRHHCILEIRVEIDDQILGVALDTESIASMAQPLQFVPTNFISLLLACWLLREGHL